MNYSRCIILSQDLEIIDLCENLEDEIGVSVECKSNLANFLLRLQESDYDLAMLDCKHMDAENLKWVKVVHRIRPKIPLIIISDEVDQKTGGQVYEEGTFYLYIRPVEKTSFQKIIAAAIAQPKQAGNKL